MTLLKTMISGKLLEQLELSSICISNCLWRFRKWFSKYLSQILSLFLDTQF